MVKSTAKTKPKKKVQKVCVLIIELTEKNSGKGKKKNLSVKKYTEGGRLANRERKPKKKCLFTQFRKFLDSDLQLTVKKEGFATSSTPCTLLELLFFYYCQCVCVFFLFFL